MSLVRAAFGLQNGVAYGQLRKLPSFDSDGEGDSGQQGKARKHHGKWERQLLS